MLIEESEYRNAPPLCELRGITKAYADHGPLAVQALDLSIRRGEFLTFLGPSGSGKTTTLMMLAGFEKPSTGSILLDGRNITDLPAHRRGLGVVFQSYALFPHMSVSENVGFPLSVRGLPASEISAHVSRALELVKLDGFGARYPRQLSGGQQQRVALARALVFEPPIILMDEPLGALDRQLREHMQIELSRLHRELGVTVVYVTHDQDEALSMSDRIAVFEGGRVRQLAAPQSLYDDPANEFVATFVGENNRVFGTVAEVTGNRCTIRLADGTMVHSRSNGDLVSGSPTFVSLRPERLICGPSAEHGRSSLRGSVVQSVFRGDHVRVCVETAAAGEIHAKMPRSWVHSLPEPGEEVVVSWDPETCLALPRSAGLKANEEPGEKGEIR